MIVIRTINNCYLPSAGCKPCPNLLDGSGGGASATHFAIQGEVVVIAPFVWGFSQSFCHYGRFPHVLFDSILYLLSGRVFPSDEEWDLIMEGSI